MFNVPSLLFESPNISESPVKRPVQAIQKKRHTQKHSSSDCFLLRDESQLSLSLNRIYAELEQSSHRNSSTAFLMQTKRGRRRKQAHHRHEEQREESEQDESIILDEVFGLISKDDDFKQLLNDPDLISYSPKTNIATTNNKSVEEEANVCNIENLFQMENVGSTSFSPTPFDLDFF